MSNRVERTVKFITQSQILKDLPPASEGFPMRKWSIKLVAVGPNNTEVPATFIEKVTYKLHPTFEKPTRVIKRPPFKVEEEGWGEFDLGVTLHYVEKEGIRELTHDLNFQETRYESPHKLVFKNPSPAFLKALAESGPVPGLDDKKRKLDSEDQGARKKATTGAWTGKAADMERLAAGIEQLEENDLLPVVKMILENKSPEMYVKSDVEEGEFHFDLYTLGNTLLNQLWDYTRKKVDL